MCSSRRFHEARDAVVHDAVVALGARHEAGILDGIEKALAVPPGVVLVLAEKVTQHGDHFVLAAAVAAGQRGVPVGGGILLPWRQAAVSLAGDARGFRIDVVEIAQHRADRVVQAVEVEAMEGDALRRAYRSVVVPQPVDEFAHVGVAPHPGREAGEGRPLSCGVFEWRT